AWVNAGTISVSASTLNLAGTFTQYNTAYAVSTCLEFTLVLCRSTVNLLGALTGNLALNGTTGSWNILSGASITNSTLTTADGTRSEERRVGKECSTRVSVNEFIK